MIQAYNDGIRIAGQSLRDLAVTHGTPALFLDESVIRTACRKAVSALKGAPAGSGALFASKALDLAAICRLVHDEGLAVDCVSAGETLAALRGGVPASAIWLHGNAKTDEDLRFAVKGGVGHIVLDSHEEASRLRRLQGERPSATKLLIRLSLGVEPTTHAYMQTGQIDSKFGLSQTDAIHLVKDLLSDDSASLQGYHTHIGSQILSERPFLETAEMMVDFAQRAYEQTGFWPRELNLGGGFGIAYRDGEAAVEITTVVPKMIAIVRAFCEAHGHPVPKLFIEPGRALVGEAGVTVYRVVAVKCIPGVRTYVAVDGGMGDNLRPALYQAVYRGALVERPLAAPSEHCRIVGRYCESGDILIDDCHLPPAAPGDLIAVYDTGAYCYAMATTYNRVPRPPVLLVGAAGADVIARRETLEDLLRLDVLPERWLKAAAKPS